MLLFRMKKTALMAVFFYGESGGIGNRTIRNETVQWTVSATSANTGCYYDYSIPLTLIYNLCNCYFLNLLHVRQNPASSISIGLSAFLTILPEKGYSPPIHSGISGLYPMVWQAGHSFIHFLNPGYCCK